MNEYPSPAVGDVWKCNDPRGGPTFRVVAVHPAPGIVQVENPDGKRPRHIRMNRFRPGRNGYSLVSRSPVAAAAEGGLLQPATTDTSMDGVFYDVGGPGEEDGFPWAFAPADSAFCERFATKGEADAYAARWIAERGERSAS